MLKKDECLKTGAKFTLDDLVTLYNAQKSKNRELSNLTLSGLQTLRIFVRPTPLKGKVKGFWQLPLLLLHIGASSPPATTSVSGELSASVK